mgnify:CR=1 FL=1
MTAPAIAFVPAANGVQIAVIPLAAPSPGGQLPISALTTWDGTPFDIETLATVQGQADALAALAAIIQALAGTLMVTGSVDVGTPAVTQSGAWSVSITGTLPGFASPPAVSVNNFPALQTVSGTVNVGNQPADPATATNQTAGNTTLTTISTALTSGAQIAQPGASAAATGAWTVVRYGAATGATSLGTGTVMVKLSAGRVRSVYVSNKSGGVIWCGVSDRASALSNGAVPDYDVALANGAGNRTFDGGEAGAYFTNGICLSFSKTQQATDSTTVVTGITVTVLFA